jgi:hypothetical protein
MSKNGQKVASSPENTTKTVHSDSLSLLHSTISMVTCHGSHIKWEYCRPIPLSSVNYNILRGNNQCYRYYFYGNVRYHVAKAKKASKETDVSGCSPMITEELKQYDPREMPLVHWE